MSRWSRANQERKLRLSALFIATALVFLPAGARGAGVTLITHGHLGIATEWVIPMAEVIPDYPGFPGTNYACYEITITKSGGNFNITQSLIGGTAPTNTDSGEILIKVDWSALATLAVTDSTINIAAALVPRLLQTNFIPGLGGRALAELPLHLVGHSRGGSLMCELSKLLGQQGVWVDQVTLLDPHPVNTDGFSDPLVPVVDAPCRIYENVLFADDYYETTNAYPIGEPVTGSYLRRLTNLVGGYNNAHSDPHLWYHGTIDGRTPTSDTQANLTSTERQTWWTLSESNGAAAGYRYSRIGGGDRSGTNQPAGLAQLRDGYNQKWDFGVSGTNNRTDLPSNNGSWPSLIGLAFAGTNRITQDESAAVSLYYHYAQPASSNAILRFWLDGDFNPYNSAGRLVAEFIRSGTGSNQIAFETFRLPVSAAGVPPGVYALCAGISDGARTRYLYASQTLTVAPGQPRPVLDIARTSGVEVRVDVTGVIGQRIVLEGSMDLRSWQPLVTNTLAAAPWSYFDLVTGIGQRFYRAALAQ